MHAHSSQGKSGRRGLVEQDMKKRMRFEFASGWVLYRDFETSDSLPAFPLRHPKDLSHFRQDEEIPIFGQEFAVFLPREQLVSFETHPSDGEESS